MIRRVIITSITIYILAFSLKAQTGILSGKVIDKNTAETLIGATVVLTGTTKGTITDFDGNFYLAGIPVGKHSISISYISYETLIFEDIEIKEDEVTPLDVQMGEASLNINTVVITASSRQRTETAMLMMQKKSANVIDGISSAQMSKLGGSNAAGALKSVPGISVQGGKYVYIRGLSDRYSMTLLNGAEIPGLDPDKNTVQMDLFPSNLLDNMVVNKTFSPDLPGSSTGGCINIITKDFPDKLTIQFSTSTEFNPQVNLRKDFLLYERSSTDILGFDNGHRDIPELASGQIPARYENDALLTEITLSFNKTMEPKQMNSFVNHDHSFSIGNQSSFLGKTLGYNFGLSYSRDFSFYNEGETGRYKLKDPEATTLSREIVLTDTKGSEEVLWAAMANLNLKLSNSSKIGFLILRNQGGESSGRYQEGKKYSDDNGMFYQTRTLKYMERSFTSAQLKGTHYYDHLNQLSMKWLSSYTKSSQDEPDLRYFTNHGENGNYEIARSLYPVPSRYFRNMNEANFDNKLNFELPLNDIKLKFGASAVYKDREFREKKITFTENQNSYAGDITSYLEDDNLFSPHGIYAQNSERSDKKNSYDGIQFVGGAYFMGDYKVNDKLRLISGLRYEYSYNSAENNSDLNDHINYSKAKKTNHDILPSINLTYQLIEDVNLRLAYNRTLARPTFRELVPLATQNFVGDYVFVGNPDLKRTLIDNIDIRGEYFIESGEIISISGFYKNFLFPIERTFNTEAANPELTLENVPSSKVYGVELEFRKNLDMLMVLKDFNYGLNVTLVKSKASIGEKELSRKRYFAPDYPEERVMYGQSPYIINTYLGYANDSIGLSANIVFNYAAEKLSIVNADGGPDGYEQAVPMLDLNISQKLGSFKITFKAKNLLNPVFKETYTYNDTEYIYQSYTKGRFYSIGFSYLIK